MSTFKFQLDSQRQNTFILPKCDTVYRVLISANTMATLVVPQKADLTYYKMAVFSGTNNFMVGTETFSLPTSTSFEACNEQLNLPAMPLYDGNAGGQITELFFRAPEQCYIYVSFYDLFIRENNPLNT